MHLEDLRDALRRRPFVPFRLCISDGATCDVQHPELCVPGRRSVFSGLTETAEPIYDHYAIVDLVQVTRYEPLSAAAPGNGQHENSH
ncbi:MAG: hypothetical protein ACK4RK_02250 [Gemmataceae bacterium]